MDRANVNLHNLSLRELALFVRTATELRDSAASFLSISKDEMEEYARTRYEEYTSNPFFNANVFGITRRIWANMLLNDARLKDEYDELVIAMPRVGERLSFSEFKERIKSYIYPPCPTTNS